MIRIKHKALFQMDSFNKLNIKTDSTISIIKEALNFGIKVYVNNPDDLTLIKNNVFVSCTNINLKGSLSLVSYKGLTLINLIIFLLGKTAL